MAKLTLSFKGRLIAIHHLDERSTTVGRDPECGICIDSLAIAPRHAELIPTDTGYLLLALDEDFPVLLNNTRVQQASLNHGDIIQVGKHELSFSEGSLQLAPPHSLPAEPVREEAGAEDTAAAQEPVRAYLQVQSGPLIGRVIVLRRSVTRLSRAGVDDLIVARDGDRHHIARLGEGPEVTINGKPMEGEEAVLENDSKIEIGALSLRFFSEGDRDLGALPGS